MSFPSSYSHHIYILTLIVPKYVLPPLHYHVDMIGIDDADVRPHNLRKHPHNPLSLPPPPQHPVLRPALWLYISIANTQTVQAG